MAKTTRPDGVADLLTLQQSVTAELVARIEAARSTLREIEARRRAIALAPVDAETLQGNIAAYLGAQELHAREEWSNPFAKPDFEPARATNLLSGTFGRHPIGVLCLLGFGGLIADQIKADAMANLNGPVTSASERQNALAEADADYLRAEVLVERLIRTAEDAGTDIPRDEAARPEIYLAKELPNV